MCIYLKFTPQKEERNSKDELVNSPFLALLITYMTQKLKGEFNLQK